MDLARESSATAPLSTLILRALRIGALLSLPLTAVLSRILPGPTQDSGIIEPIRTMLMVCAVTWIVGVVSNNWKHRWQFVIDVLCLTTAGLASLIASTALLHIWKDDYPVERYEPGATLAFAAGVLPVGLMVICDLLLRARRVRQGSEPGAVDDPALWWPLRVKVTREGQNSEGSEVPDVDDTVSYAAASITWRQRTAAVAALLAPCLALTLAVYLIPRALTTTPEAVQRLAPPVSEDSLPAMPTSLPASATWTREVAFNHFSFGVASGARGPILVTDDEVQALSSQDGSTLWSYQRPGARFANFPDTSFNWGEIYMVTSPDRKHVALLIDNSAIPTRDQNDHIVIILDTITGKVTAQWPCRQPSRIQLTDSAAMIDHDVISLSNGSHLWRTSTDMDSAGDTYTGTAGRSTFIVGIRETGGESRGSVQLRLVPDTHPAEETVLRGVITEPWSQRSDGFSVADGWVVRRTGHENQLSAAREPSWSAEAVSIDDVAAAGSDESVEAIPLGDTSGLNLTASLHSGMLVTYPAYEEQEAFSNDPPINGLYVRWIFDPMSKTAIDAESTSAPASASTGLSLQASNDGELAASIEAQATDGSSLSIPVTLTAMSATEHEWDDYPPTQLNDDHYSSEFLQLWSTPGCVIVIMDTDRGTTGGPNTYRIYGASTEAS